MAHAGSSTADDAKPFEAKDLECHRALTALEGGHAHGKLVVGMSEVLAASDAYRSSLWLVTPGGGAKPAR